MIWNWLWSDEDYIRWLTLHHLDALPQHADFISSDEELEGGLTTQMNVDDDTCSDSLPDHPSDAGHSTQHNLSSTPVRQAPPPPTSAISPIQQEATTPGSSTTTQTTESLSKSLENTRKAFSAISDFLEFPGGSILSKKPAKNHCGAKVLTSEQSLALLEEKARKKKEEEEAKKQWKWEREEKKQKAEERAKKAAEWARKAEERKRKAEEKKPERECKAQLKQSWKKCQHNPQMDLGCSVQRWAAMSVLYVGRLWGWCRWRGRAIA